MELFDIKLRLGLILDIKKRKWGWIGHSLRKSRSNVTRQALDWNPQGKRKVGRPRQTWRRSTDAEVKAVGMVRAEDDLPKPCPLEERCRGPLFPSGARGISKQDLSPGGGGSTLL